MRPPTRNEEEGGTNSSDAGRSGAKRSQSVGNAEVDLAGVGLGGDVIAALEAALGAQLLIELVDLAGVVLEERKERGLRAGRALGAAELEAGADVLDVLEVEDEVLKPLGGAATECDGLRSLVVPVAFMSELENRPWGGGGAVTGEVTHVKPRVGRSLYWTANLARELMARASLGRSRSMASRRKMRSALSVTWDGKSCGRYDGEGSVGAFVLSSHVSQSVFQEGSCFCRYLSHLPKQEVAPR